MEPGVSGATWLGTPPGNENWGEQPPHAGPVAPHPRVHLAVGALQPDVREQSGATVAGAGHVDHLLLPGPDHPVQVRVEEVQAGRGTPVAEQPRLDAFG